MGWNSWNTFGDRINEKVAMEMADAMVELGYKDAGYQYIVLDDCWSLPERGEDGRIVANPEKFPHGMKYVADYVHSKGLKFGMYSCSGVRTCCGLPSSFGHEYLDAQMFADFGVDFLKYDYCNFPETAKCRLAYLTMAQALRATGRDILFSACNWGCEDSWEWMRSIGAHMYRSTGDINDTFQSMAGIVQSQLFNHVSPSETNYNANAAGCFNDTDMLTVGMYGNGNVANNAVKQTYREYETQFAYWCASGTPLMMGCDIRNVDDECRKLLQNKELLAINQDPECRPLLRLCNDKNHPTFMRELSNNEFVLFCANFIDGTRHTHFYFPDMGIPTNCGCKIDMTNVITGEHLGAFADTCQFEVPEHGCLVLRCKFVK